MQGKMRLLAVGLAATLSLAGWLVVGFGELQHFADLVRGVTAAEQDWGFTPFALARDLGLPTGGAHVVAYALGLGLLVAVAVTARRVGGDRSAFVLAIAASLALSPIIWAHYLVLLLIPLAFARPRLSPLWLAGVLLFVCSPPDFGGAPPATWQVALALGVSTAIFAAALGARMPALGRAAAPASRRSSPPPLGVADGA